nr:hypothetical protein BaRGS_021854 [Batillaria attramentaria]
MVGVFTRYQESVGDTLGSLTMSLLASTSHYHSSFTWRPLTLRKRGDKTSLRFRDFLLLLMKTDSESSLMYDNTISYQYETTRKPLSKFFALALGYAKSSNGTNLDTGYSYPVDEEMLNGLANILSQVLTAVATFLENLKSKKNDNKDEKDKKDKKDKDKDKDKNKKGTVKK